MYNTTTTLAAALATQKLYTKVVYGSTTIGAEQVKKCVYSGSFGGADTVTIGGVTAAMVTLTLSGAHNLRDKTITVSVGADVSGAVQYVPLGTFVVATCKQVDDTTAVTAYDAAYYALGGTYTPTVSSGVTVAAVLSDVATQCGLTLATLPAAASTTGVVGDLTGKTCRDMVGYLAALVGCNALIDRDGKLALRWFAASGQSYSPSDYYNAGLTIDGTFTLACIQATVEVTTTDADGNTSVNTDTYTAGGTGTGIAVQNPYMTQAILDAVWASIGGLEYTVGSCDIFHGLLVEPGDLVTITDKAGVAHTLAVMSLTMTIDGGCKTTLQATGESATDTGAAMQGSLGGQVKQLMGDLAKVKMLIVEGPDGVTRVYGGRIDTKSLFAQDITATGTITGAKLIGAVLSGGSIDISGTFEGYTGASEGYIRTLGDESGSPQLILGMGENQIKITDDDLESIVLDGPMVYIGTPGEESNTTVYNLWVSGDVYADGKHNIYTSFTGGVLSAGSLTVSKKMGVCWISGTVTLSKSITDWTTILPAAKVPAPQHGELVPFTVPRWDGSYVQPLRGKVLADGGLQLRLGAAKEYVFTISYPIDG